jgi:hypothetical protein
MSVVILYECDVTLIIIYYLNCCEICCLCNKYCISFAVGLEIMDVGLIRPGVI